MKQLLIVVPGTPTAKKRHQTVPLQRCLKCGKTVQGQYRECPHCGGVMSFVMNKEYSHSESVKYENLVSYCARQAMTTSGVEMFTGPTRMRMTFVFPVPISRSHKQGTIARAACTNTCKKLHIGDHHTQRPDTDNCVKSVLDGGNGVLFADDCIIVELSAKKMWANEGKAEILVESLNGE